MNTIPKNKLSGGQSRSSSSKGILRSVGVISHPIGKNGEFLMTKRAADFAVPRFRSKVKLGFSAAFSKEYIVEQAYAISQGIVLKLHGIETEAQARELAKLGVFSDALPSAEQFGYVISDVVGSLVIDEKTGKEIGVVDDVWLLPANHVWVVKTPDGKELPIPVIDDVVRAILPNEKKILVTLLDGLVELEEESNEERDDDEDED